MRASDCPRDDLDGRSSKQLSARARDGPLIASLEAIDIINWQG